MKFNPEQHHRRSIRLKGYDYYQPGVYFVTVCTQYQECLLSSIENQTIKLNDVGRMTLSWWKELSNKFPGIKIDEIVIMPNHIHGIIEIVGVDLCVYPDGSHVYPDNKGADLHKGAHTGAPLHRIIQWFKTMSTNEYMRNIEGRGRQRLNGKLWQRNYYEHIIRNEKELFKIRQYIQNNPMHWDIDRDNPRIF